MAISTIEHWTTRIFANEIQRQVAFAARRGVQVLPITLGGDHAVVVYGVYRNNRMLARCTLMSDAAEVAEAVALMRPLA